MKYQLHLKQSLPFARNVPMVELEDDKILLNNVIFPWEFNPHGVRLWVIGNEFGPIGAVWADCEQDAMDELVDQNLGDCFLVPEEELAKMNDDEKEELAHLGNAGEAADLQHAWMAEVLFNGQRDFRLMMAMAEGRGSCDETLYR